MMESVGMIIPFPINMEKHVPHHQPGWYNSHQPGWYLGSSPNIHTKDSKDGLCSQYQGRDLVRAGGRGSACCTLVRRAVVQTFEGKPRVKGEKCDVFLNVEEQWRIFFVACLR